MKQKQKPKLFKVSLEMVIVNNFHKQPLSDLVKIKKEKKKYG